MTLTKYQSDVAQVLGIGFLGSAVIQTLLVLGLPNLMIYAGAAVISSLLFFYVMGLILIIKLVQSKHKSDEQYLDRKKGQKLWTEPIQKYLLISMSISFLTALVVKILQNLSYNIIELSEKEILGNIVVVMISVGLFSLIQYALLYRKRSWGNREKWGTV